MLPYVSILPVRGQNKSGVLHCPRLIFYGTRRSGYAPVTINSILTAANRFFRFLDWDELRVCSLRIQRRVLRSRERELTREKYFQLVEAARGHGKAWLALLMESIYATRIRVSKVRCTTVRQSR